MELIRTKNLQENGIELSGWGSKIEMNNKKTEDGQPNVVKRKIDKNIEVLVFECYDLL